MPRRAKAPAFTWANTTQDDQLKLLDIIGGDGHTIWSADALKEEGIPAYIVDTYTHVERSNVLDFKETIFTDNGVVEELRGVYGLTVIRSLADHHRVTSHKFGRGSEARELTEKIRAKLRGDES